MARPWLPLYPADYLADTRDLDATEHGVYLLLLMESWDRGPLPTDLGRLSRLAAVAQARTVAVILERYWRLTPAGYVNARLEREREVGEAKYQAKVARMAQARERMAQSKERMEWLAQAKELRRSQDSNQDSNLYSGQSLITVLTSSQIKAVQPQPQPQPQPQLQPEDPDPKTDPDPKEEPPSCATRSPPKGEARPKAFRPPTREEVAAYCLERGRGIDPDAWLDHYTSNGWRVGRNGMRDWKAAVRTWERTGLNVGARKQPRGIAAVDALFGEEPAPSGRIIDVEVER